MCGSFMVLFLGIIYCDSFCYCMLFLFQCVADIQIRTSPISVQAAFRWKGRTQSLWCVACCFSVEDIILSKVLVSVPTFFYLLQGYWTAADASLALNCCGEKFYLFENSQQKNNSCPLVANIRPSTERWQKETMSFFCIHTCIFSSWKNCACLCLFLHVSLLKN